MELSHRIRQIKRIDWDKVTEFVERDEGCTVGDVGAAYRILTAKVEGEWKREITIVGQSKRWWKAEWKGLRKAARKSRAARSQLRREIRAAKRKMWNDWVEEGKEVWDVVRMCKNPFNSRARCGTLKDDENIYETDKQKFEDSRSTI